MVDVFLQLRYWFRGGAFTLLAFGYLGYRYFTSEEWKQLMVSDSHRALGGDDGCPSPANPKGVAAALVIGVLYMFIGLAIVAGVLVSQFYGNQLRVGFLQMIFSSQP